MTAESPEQYDIAGFEFREASAPTDISISAMNSSMNNNDYDDDDDDLDSHQEDEASSGEEQVMVTKQFTLNMIDFSFVSNLIMILAIKTRTRTRVQVISIKGTFSRSTKVDKLT